MAKNEEAWTPYGLEHIRVRRNRRRRAIGLLALLLLLGLISVLLSQTTTPTTDTQIFANGNKVSDNGIVIEPPTPSAAPADHVTVGIEPGKVTSATTGSETQGSTLQRGSLPVPTRAAPYNWGAYMLLYGPYVLAGLTVLYFAKRKGKSDEVNYGVYKGAMPLEMITASHEAEVVTRRWAKESVFGKGRDDHLPRELAAVATASIEEDG